MSAQIEITIPDIGDFAEVEVIEVLVAVGDTVSIEDPLLTLESDKATMEIPSPGSGTLKEIKVKVGDKVSEGSLVMLLEPAAASDSPEEQPEKHPAAQSSEDVSAENKTAAEAQPPIDEPAPPSEAVTDENAYRPPASLPSTADLPNTSLPHASPGVRRFARELGADLTKVGGSGPKARILQQDVQQWVKQQLANPSMATVNQSGNGIPAIPAVDFSRFGEIETVALGRVQKISGPHLQRAWLNIPHVTHFDEADITELEAFRKSLKEEAASEGIRLTLLAFVLKIMVGALKKFPTFNASLAADGEHLILKKFFNIGIAVDTPQGLMVPVIREIDRKTIFELAREMAEISERARERKLSPADLQGGCISISSLGGIGGTGFTPIVNAPEVAIVGISRSQMQPFWDGQSFVPRLMLPISLSYDHRVIDGAEGARFSAYLTRALADARRLAL